MLHMIGSAGMATASRPVKLLRGLGDQTRLRIFRALLDHELCVCELVDALWIPQYKVSRHLGILRRLGLVRARRNGRWMYYGVAEASRLDGFSRDLVQVLRNHPPGAALAGADRARLRKRLKLRVNGCCVVGFCRC